MCTVRPLSSVDYPEWHELWNGYLRFYNTEVSEEMYLLAFNRMLSHSENEFQGLVAVKDEKLIGIAHYLYHRHDGNLKKFVICKICLYLQLLVNQVLEELL